MKDCYSQQLYPDKIAVLDLCPRPLGGMVITRINVPEGYRGRGIASKLLRECLDDADAEGVILWLAISPSDGLSYQALRNWYKRHGFHRDMDEWFCRKPWPEEQTANGKWAPQPKPHLSPYGKRRFNIERTAMGWAVYDYLLGERVSLHRSRDAAKLACRHNRIKVRKPNCCSFDPRHEEVVRTRALKIKNND
jgi:hypothetical protein